MFALLVSLAFSQSAAAFSYDDLVNLIQSKNLKSVEAVLPELPADLRSNYTLMRESRSLQGASAQSPRVIMFGRDASLILTFNGDSRQTGFDSFEAIQFRRSERRFDFHQIKFPTEANKLVDVEYSENNKTTDGQISCTMCHGGNDPRPNWNNYHTWPGAYGGDDDNMPQEDLVEYMGFTKTRATHPRYRWLIQGNDPGDPFMGIGRNFDLGHRPNVRFSDLVGSMNALRAARILKSKLSREQQLLFAKGALQCDSSKAEMPGLFAQIGLTHSEWSTQIMFDAPTNPVLNKLWEHQSGHNLLSEDVPMVLIRDWADEGDADFKGLIEHVNAYLEKRYTNEPGRNRDHVMAMHFNAPFLDHFGDGGHTNLAKTCSVLKLK